MHRLMHGYAEMYRVPQEQLPQFEQQFHTIAEAQVRRDLVLDAVAEAQGAPGHRGGARRADRRDGRGARRAGRRGVRSLQKAKRLRELERAITEEKVFDFLLSQSTVEEVKS